MYRKHGRQVVRDPHMYGEVGLRLSPMREYTHRIECVPEMIDLFTKISEVGQSQREIALFASVSTKNSPYCYNRLLQEIGK